MNRVLKSTTLLLFGVVWVSAVDIANAAIVTINSKEFDVDQFTNATVTYRPDADGGTVSFDGKNWDNEVGVNYYTLAELASGQYGGDPGDQISLNNRSTPDWLQLNYGGAGVTLFSDSEFVIYEISSATSAVDSEGLSFRVSFNNGAFINASLADATFFASPGGSAENTNQIVFNLASILGPGATLSTVRIENLNTGSGTSDPDFIFAGVTANAVPEPSSLALFGIASFAAFLRRPNASRKKRGLATH